MELHAPSYVQRQPSAAELVYLFTNDRGVFAIGRHFQILGIGLPRPLAILLLFAGLSEPQPCVSQAAVPPSRLLKTIRGGAVAALLEVIVADLQLFLGL